MQGVAPWFHAKKWLLTFAGPKIFFQTVSQERGYASLLKGIHVHTNGDIMPGHTGNVFAFSENPVTELDRSVSQVEHADFHLDFIAVTQRLHKIGFEVNAGQSDTVVIDHLWVLYTKGAFKKLLQGHVKVV